MSKDQDQLLPGESLETMKPRKSRSPKKPPATDDHRSAPRIGETFEAVRLNVREGIGFEEWDELGTQIAIMHNASPWWIGDWYNAGERAFGETASQARAISDRIAVHGNSMTPETVIDYASLARKFPPEERRESLTAFHYRTVRALEKPRALELLERAEREGWSSRDLKRNIEPPTPKEPEAPARVITTPGVAYDLILADPPWRYSNSGVNGAATKHYETMTPEAIKTFLVQEQIEVAEDAVLLLWVTNPMLPLGLEVMAAWGFEYKTNLAWVKQTVSRRNGKEERKIKFGAGFYFRGAHELLLLGVKGSNMGPASKSERSVLLAEALDHSQKPEEVYDVAERMYPNAHRIELFARHVRFGWDRIGKEAPR